VKELSDELVLAQASRGDREAFGELYQRYVGRIYNYIYYRTGSVHDAEDLTARVFFRAMRHIPNYKDRGLPFSAWLYRIAHNLVANWHRDNNRRKEISLDDSVIGKHEGDHPEQELVSLEERENLFKLLHSLPADRQHLIILKFIEQMSNAEIGQVMGKTEGAVKSLYHRTLLALRNEYQNINHVP
jgi:RNA polymerase sigma-70 factor (ECF subfamily)